MKQALLQLGLAGRHATGYMIVLLEVYIGHQGVQATSIRLLRHAVSLLDCHADCVPQSDPVCMYECFSRSIIVNVACVITQIQVEGCFADVASSHLHHPDKQSCRHCTARVIRAV